MVKCQRPEDNDTFESLIAFQIVMSVRNHPIISNEAIPFWWFGEGVWWDVDVQLIRSILGQVLLSLFVISSTYTHIFFFILIYLLIHLWWFLVTNGVEFICKGRKFNGICTNADLGGVWWLFYIPSYWILNGSLLLWSFCLAKGASCELNYTITNGDASKVPTLSALQDNYPKFM